MIDIGKELESILDDYNDHIIEITNEAISVVAEATSNKLRQTGPRRTGKYQRSWGIEDGQERLGIQGKVIRNKKHYRLTHLLEFGHLNRDGSRTRAFPHIANKLEEATTELVQELKERL